MNNVIYIGYDEPIHGRFANRHLDYDTRTLDIWYI